MISGREGGIVFANSRQGLTVKKADWHRKNPPQRTMTALAILDYIRMLWDGNFLDAQTKWKQTAASRLRQNRLGVPVIPSAFGLWSSFEYFRQDMLGRTLADPELIAPPVATLTAPYAIAVSASFTASPGSYVTTVVPSTFVPSRIALYISRFGRPSVGSSRSWRYAGGLAFDDPWTVDWYAYAAARNIVLLQGERVHLKIFISNATAYQYPTPPVYITTTVA